MFYTTANQATQKLNYFVKPMDMLTTKAVFGDEINVEVEKMKTLGF